jgi:AcrR family transcriptional regulator
MSPATIPPRRRRLDGLRTYDAIVNAAADLASQEGLESLTIGTLAERLEMSKSGLFAHFGSKEGLQLATIEAARKRYVAAVLEPAMKAPPGLARLEALCERTIDYLAAPEFPGGCFFVAAQAGIRAKPGNVRDAVLSNKNYLRRQLVRMVKAAQARKELRSEADPEQLAYELVAVMDAASWSIASKWRDADLGHAARAVRGIIASARPIAALRSKPERTGSK